MALSFDNLLRTPGGSSSKISTFGILGIVVMLS